MYDAIIVGARCAGSATALLLARRGYRVLLMDRSSFPSDTISGHYIMHRGTRLLGEWGLLDQVIASGCPPVTRAASDWGDFLLAADIPTTDGYPACIGPRRTVLDQLLIDAAVAAGVELREGVVVEGLESDGEQVTGIRGRTGAGTGIVERARIVVGADGKRSTIARLAGAPAYLEQPSLTCWYMAYWGDCPCDGLELHWRQDRLVLAFQTNDNLALVAVAWPRREFQRFRSDIAGNYRATLEQMASFQERVPQMRQAERFVGMADVPNFFRRPHGPGWALVGDAGHHKDPTLARGISDAFCDAALLAEALDAGWSGEAPLAESLARYEQQRNARAIPENEANLQAAQLDGWDTSQALALRAALAASPADAGQFYASRMQVIPPQQFMAPENISRIMRQAQERHQRVPA
jgi:2-polyprenyl-6-methoxyphenol hydroxylase-like FAD-dependent oxidoreductase